MAALVRMIRFIGGRFAIGIFHAKITSFRLVCNQHARTGHRERRVVFNF